MGFRDAIASLLGVGTKYEGITYVGSSASAVLGFSPEELYRTQPHLQTVVSFMARNVAHLGLPAFERVSDTNRRRLMDDPLPTLLSNPNPTMTGYELKESLVSDLGLYDIAYWFWGESSVMASGWFIQPIPPSWVVESRGGNAFGSASYMVQVPNGTRQEIPAEHMLVFHGWNPGRPKKGSAPVDALKNVLAEQIQAWEFRQQLWRRGGRVGTYLTRPATSVPWSSEARQKFTRDWSDFSGSGAKSGSTPLFEDGIEMKRVGFSAKEEQWIEASKLSLQTVASIYHVNPVMVGILDNANFSNTKEFRKMLYSETLGPVLQMIQDRINTFLVPKVTKAKGVYVEFNIQAKLAGDFEEQAAILSSSTGAPWMTRNEARARQNLPQLAGGDELVTPLNVLIGGQASPRDAGSQNLNSGTAMVKASVEPIRAPETYEEKTAQVLRAFFKRQGSVVLSRLGAKADPQWWDGKRWDSELSDDLYKLAVMTTKAVAQSALDAVGLAPDAYDVDRTLKFLRAVADSRAGAINAATQSRIVTALEDEESEMTPSGVFEEAEKTRSVVAALTLITTFSAFAMVEAARQNSTGATKTWVVGSDHPRPDHAAMDGETVKIDDNFSNGANWPGDPVLGAEGVANCLCGVEITYP